MRPGQRLWTRDELVLAINLYCKLPFGRLHSSNPEIIQLSKILNRTPSAVALKLVNFASLDPSLKARGIKGASNSSKLDREVWEDFFHHWEVLSYESEQLLARYNQTSVQYLNHIPEDELPKEGKMREQIIRTRVNQSFFRRSILAAYNYTCCITALNKIELLVAAHIRPWSMDEENRMNPRNGLAFNALHDKAFELGYITITPDYQIKVSSALLKQANESVQRCFVIYENKMINLPSRFLPDPKFLNYHNNERFKT